MHRCAPTTRSRAPRRSTNPVRLLTVLCTVAGLLALPVGPASAHDELISTEPTADAVLDAPPTEVALEFTADLLAISPTIVLSGQAGLVPLDAPAVVGPRVSVPVPADLPAGDYTVVWRVVSGDGHPIQGSFGFSLRGTSATASASSSIAPTSTPTPIATPTSTSTPTPSATTAGPAPTSPGSSAAVTAGLAVLAVTVLGIVLARRLRSRRR